MLIAMLNFRPSKIGFENHDSVICTGKCVRLNCGVSSSHTLAVIVDSLCVLARFCVVLTLVIIATCQQECQRSAHTFPSAEIPASVLFLLG